MEADRWTRIERLFEGAREVPPDERAAFLRTHCEDAAVREEVASLLAARERAPRFFEAAAREVISPMLDEFEEKDGGPDAALDLAGRTVGGYRLVEEIGVGGMSVVYRAERAEADFDQTVAVKLLQRRFHDTAAADRFRAERQLLASLDHPGIADLIDGGVTEGGRPYLVMEYVEGQPITAFAEENGLGLEQRLDLLDQVFDAVEAAHRQLVVHRDLKPSNVLVTETEAGPRVQLLDFGIAKLMDDSMPVTRPETRTGQHLMTPAYAAPEQVSGDEITTATDVYQLGVLAYELLAGVRPFDLTGSSLMEIERILLEQTPEKPSERAETGANRLRGDLDTIVLKALRKEPGRRYGSVEALAADVRRHQEGEPVEARPATLGYRAWKFVSRNRTTVGAGLIIALLVGAYAVTVTVQANRLAEQRNRARTEAKTAEQVSEFLVGLFEASNPYQEQDTVTARTLLRRGENQVSELEGQPVVRAQMLQAMGEAHHGLGNYGQADSLLQRVLSLHRRSDIHDPSRRAHVLAALGDLRSSEYQWEGARTRYQSARSLLPDRPSSWSRSDSLRAADVFANLGETLRHVGSLDSAETAVRRALALRRRLHGPNHKSTMDAKETLAYVLRKSGSPDDAERLYREVLASERKRADSLDMAQTLNDLAAIFLVEWGDPVEAERLWQEALRIRENQLGPAHPQTLVTRGNNLSFAHELQGDFAAAERVHREQLRAVRAHHPSDHWRVGKWAHALGEVLLFRETDLTEAEALLREGVRIVTNSGWPETYVRAFEAVLARCLALRGDNRRAFSLLRNSRAVLTSDSVDLSVYALSTDLAHANAGLGLIHLRRGHYAQAESLLTAARDTFESKYSEYRDSLDARTPLPPVRQVDRHLSRLRAERDQGSSRQEQPGGDT